MKSTNFLVAAIDKQFNLFKETEENKPQFIAHIAEHIKRLEEISDGHHFYIDDMAFKALGERGFPLRFTRIFSDNHESIKGSSEYRTHATNELDNIFLAKEKYSPGTQVFFIGGSEFLKRCQKWSKKLLLTVVDQESDSVIDTLPLESLQSTFFKRKDIHPELLDSIKQYRKMKQKLIPKTVTEIADNGMKVTKTIEAPKMISIEDSILNTPDYMFYEFSR